MKPEILTYCLAQIEVQTIDWLWEPFIAKGELTLIDGDPGVGKSWLALAIAKAVTRGDILTGMTTSVETGNVLYVTTENDKSQVVKPRIDSLGADSNRFYMIDRPFELNDSGLSALREEIQKHSVKLVIVDPLFEYIGVNPNRGDLIRNRLSKLAAISKECKCATLLIRHLGKSLKSKAIYQGLGSIGITATCRSNLLVGSDPENKSCLAFVQTKNNLAPKGSAVGFRIEDDSFSWMGKSDLTEECILGANISEEDKSKMEEAKDFLIGFLSEGESSNSEVRAESKKQGITDMTLRRAAKTLGVIKKRKGRSWSWSLPSDRKNDEQLIKLEHELLGQDVTPDHQLAHAIRSENQVAHDELVMSKSESVKNEPDSSLVQLAHVLPSTDSDLPGQNVHLAETLFSESSGVIGDS